MNRYVDLRHEGFRFGLLVVALRVALVIWPLHTCAEPGNQEHRSQSDFAIPAKVFDGCGIVVSSQAVGSGFWVASNRFVTCAHVIGEAKARISVHTRNGERYWPRVVRFFSVTDDVAVLELDSPHHTWLTLAGRADLNDPVCSVANSEGAEVLKLDYGKIISEGPRFIEISAKIKPGCSGGPIVSANGEVVGMSSFVRWENVAIREGRIVYDTRFDKARRFAVKAGLLHLSLIHI
ncbi:MAG: serine protease, partial [Verrucomicrobiae bacterium]|nr:serine protease [Verrucomicrobiae bacterium]